MSSEDMAFKIEQPEEEVVKPVKAEVVKEQPDESEGSVKLSDAAAAFDGGMVRDGSIGGVVVDVSGVRGGTISRMYRALSPDARVFVEPGLVDEYAKTMERYFGNGKKSGKRVVFKK